MNLIAENSSNAKNLAMDRLDSPLSDKGMRDALLDAELKTEQDYKDAIAAAEYEHGKDSLQVKALELAKQKEINDLKQRGIDLTREQSEAEIDRINNSQQDILDRIDLNGGKGTVDDYAKLIAEEGKELQELNADYEREYALLLQIESELGANSSEYRDQEQVVNGIADNITECTKNTKKWGKELLSLAIDEISESIDDLNKKLKAAQNETDGIDTIIAGAVAYIQDQIDAQEDLKKPIEEQLEALQKTNDERERMIA